MLDQEFQYFKDNKDELLKQYSGKFIAIVGTQVVGVFDAELEAYNAMKKDHKVGTFLIQQCVPGEDTRTFHSRVAI